MTTVTLLPMRWWHIQDIVGLEADLFGDEAWSQEAFWSELASAGSYYLVATQESAAESESLLGYAGLAVSGPEAYVQTIGVARPAQRRGIGRRLMEALLTEAVKRRARECWLEVRTDNQNAQQLYRTLGFVDRGIRRGYYQPSGADALVMAVPLVPLVPLDPSVPSVPPGPLSAGER
jgi:ribosomal-protein-alanine N-acetyltransferase